MFIQIWEDPDQLLRHALFVDHLRRLRIKAVRFDIGRQNTPIAVNNICPLRHDFGRADAGTRLDDLTMSQGSHTQTNDTKGRDKHHAEQQQPPFSPLARSTFHSFVTLANILFFNLARVFASLTGLQDRCQRTQRRADHWLAS